MTTGQFEVGKDGREEGFNKFQGEQDAKTPDFPFRPNMVGNKDYWSGFYATLATSEQIQRALVSNKELEQKMIELQNMNAGVQKGQTADPQELSRLLNSVRGLLEAN